MRAVNLYSSPQRAQDTPRSNDPVVALRRFTEVRRELLLEDRLDRLVTVLERLVGALERRAS